MNLIEVLKWRYATKKMNGSTVPQDKLEYILEAARLAPSSFGIQPYEIFVISNRDLLEKIKLVSRNQSQITDCSHLLVFATWDSYSFDRMAKSFDRIIVERGMPANAMDEQKKLLWGKYEPLSNEWHCSHSCRQAYIALGIAIIAAAEQQVDATPMEGFIPEEIDKLLALKEKGLKSAVLLAIGYRDAANDWLVNLKKVRTPKEIFITEIK